MSVCIFIPARKGSKRIKNKNKKVFLGLPMILWPINILKKEDFFNDIFVSTDDPDIAALCLANDCKVLEREPKFCDDHTTSIEVVKNFAKKEGHAFKFIVMVYPTTPLLDIESIKLSIENLSKNEKYHSCSSIISYSHPIERRLILKNGNLIYADLNAKNKRTQDLSVSYHDAANFYVFKKSFFVEDRNLFDDTTFGIEVDKKYSIDIDNEKDWNYAELMLKNFKR
tara:strand:- start:86 stop:763 length:678 start_codon:yes stop_codon:yes gene_type:complete